MGPRRPPLYPACVIRAQTLNPASGLSCPCFAVQQANSAQRYMLRLWKIQNSNSNVSDSLDSLGLVVGCGAVLKLVLEVAPAQWHGTARRSMAWRRAAAVQSPSFLTNKVGDRQAAAAGYWHLKPAAQHSKGAECNLYPTWSIQVHQPYDLLVTISL